MAKPMKLIDLVKRIEAAGLSVSIHVSKGGDLHLSAETIPMPRQRQYIDVVFSCILDKNHDPALPYWDAVTIRPRRAPRYRRGKVRGRQGDAGRDQAAARARGRNHQTAGGV